MGEIQIKHGLERHRDWRIHLAGQNHTTIRRFESVNSGPESKILREIGEKTGNQTREDRVFSALVRIIWFFSRSLHSRLGSREGNQNRRRNASSSNRTRYRDSGCINDGRRRNLTSSNGNTAHSLLNSPGESKTRRGFLPRSLSRRTRYGRTRATRAKREPKCALFPSNWGISQ